MYSSLDTYRSHDASRRVYQAPTRYTSACQHRVLLPDHHDLTSFYMHISILSARAADKVDLEHDNYPACQHFTYQRSSDDN